MNGSEIAAIIVAIVGVLGVLFERLSRKPRSRDRVRTDLEILSLLPPDSKARDALRGHIDTTIDRIVHVEDMQRRDWPGAVVSVTFLALSGGLWFGAIDRGGAWQWLMVPALLTGLFGVVSTVQTLTLRKRDTYRRAIEE
ncbi:hypothetical protein [Streptomyces hokutonensis]|uniref:Integral membrane protein n=1 Tax=Streptomyces hokutonensis TaxID=1306990 RepID=A0ABW6ML21_9ACTN